MNFETLENEIVLRLETLIKTSEQDVEGTPTEVTEVEVIPMPETSAEFNRNFETARITAAFNGKRPKDEGLTLTGGFQNDILTFAIVIQARLLRGDTGAYSLYNEVDKLLLGYRLTSCEPLISRTFELISDEDDIFTFIAFYECEKISIKGINEPVIIPGIKEITVNGQGFNN